MLSEKVKKVLRRQHYAIVGKNSSIQICRWAKKALLDEGFCYKQQFYGIKSHGCCQMSPCVMFCQNKCLHCWRAIELSSGMKMNLDEADKPSEIIEGCILAQRKMISGFGGNKRINRKKLQEAQNPSQFAISLSGEPTIYPYIAELILELRKRKITSFLVTNGLNPEKIIELKEKNALPTQIYLSLNSPNKKEYEKWHRSLDKKAWAKFTKTLRIFSMLKKKTRTVIRMTLVKDMNLHKEKEYARIIKEANPDFVEVKAFMSVGFARKRIAYEKMPLHPEIRIFAEKLAKLTKLKVLDEKIESRVVVLGKDRRGLKIKKNQI
jgi:tRNA wybutosine-synthesizing protein 1